MTLNAGAATANLTGIALLHFGKQALLEIKTERGQTIRPTLGVGERVDVIEVIEIDEKAGQVKVKNDQKVETLSLGTGESPAGQTFNFKDADSLQVLESYQNLQGFTVIRAPSVPVFKVTLKSDGALSRPDAAALVEKAFRDQGLFITLRSPKFAVATTFSQKRRAEALLSAPPSATAPGEKFPPGLVKFSEAEDRQVLEIYSELTGRMVLRSPQANSTKVTLRSQTELNRAEVVWLLESALKMGGIALAPDGEKFVYALPLTRNVTAPKVPANPLAAGVKGEPFPPGMLKFEQASGSQALDIYAELIGRKPVKDSVPNVRLSLRNQVPLTRAEVVYAMDAMAALNRLRFVAVGEEQVKLEALPPALKDAAAPPK